MVPIEVTRAYAEGSEAHPTDGSIVVDGPSVYGYAVVWALVIVGIVELIKRLWLARTGEPTNGRRPLLMKS